MIRETEKLKAYFKLYELSSKTILVYLILISLIYKSRIREDDLRNRKQELLKIAKKGNVLVNLKTGSGNKGGGQVRIFGTLLEIPKPNKVEVLTEYGNIYFVPSKMNIDSGQIYPVWYTDNLELLIARSVESREGNIQYLKEFNKKYKFKIDPAYIVLTVLQLFMFFLDFMRNVIRSRTNTI